MDTKLKKNDTKHLFDFDAGYLVKSPCKKCNAKGAFPKCLDSCEIIKKIHLALANVITCSR